MLVEIYEMSNILYEYEIKMMGEVDSIKEYMYKKWKGQRISKYDGKNLITKTHINECLEKLLEGDDVEINDNTTLLLLTYNQSSPKMHNITGEYFVTSSYPGGGFDIINCETHEEALKQYNIRCKPDDMDSDGELNYCVSLFQTDGISKIKELLTELIEYN
jgi:hypothetical protein